MLREGLQKSSLIQQPRKYDYGCVMTGLELDKESWNTIQGMIDEEDVYFGKEDDKGYGREMEPHVTILYGIHEDVPLEDVENKINSIKSVDILLDAISSFTNEEFDVLKFDIKSNDLSNLNADFKKLPHTSKYPDYHPHATIAYLKKGLADKYIKKMKKVKPLETIPSKLLYSMPNGDKKEYNFSKKLSTK